MCVCVCVKTLRVEGRWKVVYFLLTLKMYCQEEFIVCNTFTIHAQKSGHVPNGFVVPYWGSVRSERVSLNRGT